MTTIEIENMPALTYPQASSTGNSLWIIQSNPRREKEEPMRNRPTQGQSQQNRTTNPGLPSPAIFNISYLGLKIPTAQNTHGSLRTTLRDGLYEPHEKTSIVHLLPHVVCESNGLTQCDTGFPATFICFPKHRMLKIQRFGTTVEIQKWDTDSTQQF